MQALDTQARLEYARAAVAVMRALQISDRTMRYGEFATAIGLITVGGKWEPWHRQQITDILNLVAAVQRQSGPNAETQPLQFERIVNEDGQPGKGFYKSARITTE